MSLSSRSNVRSSVSSAFAVALLAAVVALGGLAGVVAADDTGPQPQVPPQLPGEESDDLDNESTARTNAADVHQFAVHPGPGGPEVRDGDREQLYSTVITGQVEYEARNGTMQPARRVKVHVRKDNTVWFNSGPFAKDTTNETGHYKIRVDTDKRETAFSPKGATLHLKVQALAKNPAVKVIAFKKNFQGGSGRIYFVSKDLSIQVGQANANVDFDVTGQSNRRAFQLAEWTLRTREFAKREASHTRPRIKVELPANGWLDNRYFGHINKIKIGTDNWDTKNHTARHEYGHALLGSLQGGWKIPKAKTWLNNENGKWFPCHQLYSETASLYAWYEGFAEFTEAASNGTPSTDNMALEWKRWYNDSDSGGDCHGGDASTDYDGNKVEGAIANILWDMYDGKNENFDQLDVGLREMYATISKNQVKSSISHRNSKVVRSANDMWNQFVNDSNHAALGRIYFQYGIQKPDRFENNDRPPAAPTVQTNATYGAQLNYGDSADHFEFAADANQRITVNTDQIQGNANVSMHVFGPNGNELANSTTGGSNGQVQFQAPDYGDYRVKLTDVETNKSAGTYNLTITVEPDTVYDDRFEQNERPSNAPTLSLGDHDDLAVTSFDAFDYYAIQGTAGKTIEVQADFDHSDVDVDLYAYYPGASLSGGMTAADKSKTNTDDEHVTIRAHQNATYYVKVIGNHADKPEEYSLSIGEHGHVSQAYEDNDYDYSPAKLKPILNKTGRPVKRAGNVVAGVGPDDPDYYTISLNSAETLSVDHVAGKNVDVQILGPNGRYYDRSYGVGSELSASGSTTYLVEVTSRTYVPEYNLSVAYGRGAGSDQFEPNNHYPDATPATPAITGITATSGTKTLNNLELAGESYDKDFFEVNLSSGEKLEATAKYLSYEGDLKVEIIGTSGQTTTATETTSGSYTEETASVQASSEGQYYVRIFDATNPSADVEYDLTLKRTESVTGGTGPKLEFETVDVGGFTPDFSLAVTKDEQSLLENITLGGGVQVGPGSGKCKPADAEVRSRQVSTGGGQSVRISKSYSFTVDYPSPCKVKASITAPKRAQVDLYVTLDGSKPTTSNYQLKADGAGSNETLVITRSDGLRRGATIRVMAEGYPIAGTYEVIVEKYSDSGP